MAFWRDDGYQPPGKVSKSRINKAKRFMKAMREAMRKSQDNLIIKSLMRK